MMMMMMIMVMTTGVTSTEGGSSKIYSSDQFIPQAKANVLCPLCLSPISMYVM